METPTHTSRFQGQSGDRKKPFPALWLTIARGGWLATAGMCVFLLAIAIPVRYAQLTNPPLQIRASLFALGLPLPLYALSNLVFESCVVLGFFIAATLLFWRRSDEWFPLLVAFLLITFGTSGPIIVTLQEVNPVWSPLTGLIDIVSWGLLGFFLSLFPDGRFVPRWSLWYNIVMIVYSLLWDIPMLPATFHPSNWPPLLFILFQLGPFALFLGFQIYRYRYVSGPVQRQQTKWLLFGVAVVLCTIPFGLMSITPSRTPATIFGLFVSPALQLLWLSIPLSLSIAILRYRLWDIDLIINRTLVYGSLTVSIVGLYILTVGTFGMLLQAQANLSLVHLPLLYQGEQVGELLLAPRAPGEVFSSADHRLLEDLARQTGMAVHAVDLTRDLQRLTQNLQRSRTALVTAREEERRRLRRDLHDGLGSALASLNWRAGALRQALTHDPTATHALVVEQQEIIRSTIADIRRLVYDLRPPSLDELGLVGALRERAAHVTIPTSTADDREYGELLQVNVEVAGELPSLPAANEVAAYRIVQEALTNVVRHAHATICQVRLSVVEGTLYVEVTDDGVGMAAGQQAGVGLHSMRERAAELGGKCHIQPGPRGGTQVCASLPFPTD